MNFSVPKKIWLVTAGALLLMAAAGCDRNSVKVYHVDASATTAPTPPPIATPSAMPTTMPDGLPAPDNSGQPSLQYILPAGWEKKALSPMRVASFGIAQNGKQADVSIIPMGGMAGGNLANVNRWRGQVGLGSIEQDDVNKMTEKVVVAGQDAELFDIAGTGSERIIASVLHRDDTAWFFKITGDAALVEAQKPAFITFLKSVQFGTPAATATMDMNQLPPSHPPIEGMSLGSQNSLVPNANTTLTGGINSEDSGKPTWTVPAGWQEAPLAQFLVAKFVITGTGGAEAAVNVSSLAGDGGGLLANVNRWRGQLGLNTLNEMELAHLAPTMDLPDGSHLFVVDFTGTDSRTGKPAELVGAVVPQNGQTWFYKLMGDADLVAQQKAALIKFVQSAKYLDVH